MGLIALNTIALLLIFQAACVWPYKPQWPRVFLAVLLAMLMIGQVVWIMQLPPRPPGMYGR